MDNLVALTEAALKLVAEAQDLATLDNVRVDYLGKKGSVSALMKNLGQLSPEERPAAGAEINQAKDKIQDAIAARKAALEDAQIAAKLASEIVDVTLPGRGEHTGGLHPVTRTLQRRYDAVDRIEWFRAPLIMGEEARPGIAGADIVKLSDARRWKRIQVRELDSDLWETYERA